MRSFCSSAVSVLLLELARNASHPPRSPFLSFLYNFIFQTTRRKRCFFSSEHNFRYYVDMCLLEGGAMFRVFAASPLFRALSLCSLLWRSTRAGWD